MEALDLFYPERMADRILGMGDVVSLVERAQEQFDEEEAKKLHKKIAKNEFGFDDFLTQINQIKKMGNMKDLMGMLPGVGKAINEKTINYISKYMLKDDLNNREFTGKVLTSAGMGKQYFERGDWKCNQYNGKNTREYYVFKNGTRAMMPRRIVTGKQIGRAHV